MSNRMQDRENQIRLRELVARRSSLNSQIAKTTRTELNAIKSRISALYSILIEDECTAIADELVDHIRGVQHSIEIEDNELTYSQVSSGLVVLNHPRNVSKPEHPEIDEPQRCLS